MAAAAGCASAGWPDPGRQIGQLWVTEAEIGFAAWPGMGATDPAGPGRDEAEGVA